MTDRDAQWRPPSRLLGTRPRGTLALPASGAHGLEKPQDRLAAAVALPVPSPSASSSGLALFCFKVAGFCLFYLIFLCRRHLYVMCIFPQTRALCTP